MQRVRAGLTGLAAIFLMVLVAAAGLKPARPALPDNGPPVETLAVLGVAPGSSGDADRKALAAIPPRPKTARRLPTT